jgi:hypothetical protein
VIRAASEVLGFPILVPGLGGQRPGPKGESLDVWMILDDFGWKMEDTILKS